MPTFLDRASVALHRLTRRFGYELLRCSAGPLTMEGGLAHFARRFQAATVIDVGASDGSWTEIARRCWPEASSLLIEAQGETHAAALRRIAQRLPRTEYVIAAAGARAGTTHFDASGPTSGRASTAPTGARDIEVPMTAVDDEVAVRALQGPFVLKLDTHGFEIPILEGARRTLERTSLLVVEVYNFTLSQESVRFPDMCRHLEGAGFRPIGIVDLMYRPKDGALWQFDCFFARSDRPEFRSDTYA